MSRLIAGAIASTIIVSGHASAHIIPFPFGMSAAQVVTGSDSAARGGGWLYYDHHTLLTDIDLFISGINVDDLIPNGPNGTPIHIHMAPILEEGPIVSDLGWWGNFEQEDNGIRLTLRNIYLSGWQGNVYSDPGDVQFALYNYGLYVQIYTEQYPLGEIRGQIHSKAEFFGDMNTSGFKGGDLRGPVPAPGAALVLGLVAMGTGVRRRRGAA